MREYDEIRSILNVLEGYDNCVSQNGEIVELNFGTSYDEIIKEIGRLRLIFHPDLYQHNNLSIKEEECNRITAGLNRLNDILTHGIKNGNIDFDRIYNVFNEFAKKQEEDRANKRMKYFNFDGGKIEQRFDKDHKPKRLKISYTNNYEEKEITLYEYEWTDNNNRRSTLYSELDIDELFRFQDVVLSPSNLRRIALYDVENQDSQYGYAGKVDNQGRIITNPYVKNHFRDEKINSQSNTPPYIKLHNNRFVISPEFDDRGQITCQGVRNGKPSNIYFYMIIDQYNFGDHRRGDSLLWSTHSWEELCNPNMREYYEEGFLSPENIVESCRRGWNLDPRRPEEKAGYVDDLNEKEIAENRASVRAWYMSRMRKIGMDCGDVLPEYEPDEAGYLKQKSLKVKKTIDGNVIINELFQYTFIDNDGNEHEFLCSNDEFELRGYWDAAEAPLLCNGDFSKKKTITINGIPYLGHLYLSEDRETVYCGNKFYLDLLDIYDNQINGTNSEAKKLSIMNKVVGQLSQLYDKGCVMKAQDLIKKVFPVYDYSSYHAMLDIEVLIPYFRSIKPNSERENNQALENLKRRLNTSDKHTLKSIMGLLANRLSQKYDTIDAVGPAMKATMERLNDEIDKRDPAGGPDR